jgi:hypothetical protein
VNQIAQILEVLNNQWFVEAIVLCHIFYDLWSQLRVSERFSRHQPGKEEDYGHQCPKSQYGCDDTFYNILCHRVPPDSLMKAPVFLPGLSLV